MDTVRIGLIGDYQPSVPAHTAIPRALHLASKDIKVNHVWLPTRALQIDSERLLQECDGIWCVPGCPYESMEGALNAIRFAREHDHPFLGTSGGFQHAIIEFIRNVGGIADAAHGEVTINAKSPVICLLDTPLRGTQGDVTIIDGTKFASLYGVPQSTELYSCSFGFNPKFRNALESAGMVVGAVDSCDGVHGVELPEHPFFVATLYLIGHRAMSGYIHPIVRGFVESSHRRLTGRKGSSH